MHWRAFAFCLRWPCYFMPWRKTVCVIVTLPGFLRGLSNCWFKVDCRSNYKLIFAFLFHCHSIATQGNQDLTILEYEQRMAPQRIRVSVAPEVAWKVGSPGHVGGAQFPQTGTSCTQCNQQWMQRPGNKARWGWPCSHMTWVGVILKRSVGFCTELVRDQAGTCKSVFILVGVLHQGNRKHYHFHEKS